MNHFEPTNVVKDAARNTRMFVKENKMELRDIVKSISVYLIVLVIATLFVNYQLQMQTIEYMKGNPPPKDMSKLLGFLNDVQRQSASSPIYYVAILINVFFAYCFAVIAVSWHRLVLLGKERYEPMHILAPKKHEIDFVVVWTLIGTIIPMIFAHFTEIGIATIIVLLIILPYLTFKIGFYFPARALNSHMSFGNSFQLTKGYFWKFMFTIIRSFWRWILVFVLVMFAVGFVSGVLGVLVFDTPNAEPYLRGAYNQVIVQMLQTVVMIFFFQPLFVVLGVTVLSNFFQHALRNKPEAVDVKL